MPTNTAAWINAKNAKLEVGPAPYTSTWMIQSRGLMATAWLRMTIWSPLALDRPAREVAQARVARDDRAKVGANTVVVEER